MQNLQGQVALVTGSAQGIGKAIALRLAQEGADIVIVDRNDDSRAEEVLGEIKALGRRVVVDAGDIGRVDDIQRIIRDSAAQLGRLDILVNNAGIEHNASFIDIAEADYDAVLDVNLKGTFFMTQAFVRHLRSANRPGRIINVSSVHEELPFPHFTTYCASKGGLKMLMRNLAIELAPFGITVNNIAPGAIETPINTRLMHSPELLKALIGNIPLGRLGKPEDVAGMAAYLAGPDAAYVTGATMVVDGGLLWNYSEQ
ncbi:SDR family NAD(P)-dependent oxidoreductase [Martelella alba]|uniref:3-oxoacyl-ACP reductase FabG n=1 Tax=Martelella alba TaxID=2590451 RepID=A0ABY2SNY7_9HYPH|nr:3-oxoacyl-ACP reductase family protein [Martelella alba]TKI07249.1 3-oxoacyl-ACP reductase FabG [Martelella alba]